MGAPTKLPTIAAVVVSVLFAGAAQVIMKGGLDTIGALRVNSGLARAMVSVFLNPRVLGGLALYGMSTVFYLFALSRADLSFVYPLLALNFIIVALLSRLVLGESLGPSRIAGIMIAAVGVALVARS